MMIHPSLRSASKALTMAAALAAVISTASARQWTSSDGEKSFDGTFISERGDKVTVDVNGRRLTFEKTKLSEKDQEWLAEKAKANAATSGGGGADLSKQTIGKELDGKLSILSGKRMKSHKLSKAPEYYILYFSASW